jgi:protein-disulfide isomerase
MRIGSILWFLTLGCSQKNAAQGTKEPNPVELRVAQEIRNTLIPMTFPLTFDGSEPRLGSSKDLFQLVQFSDFQCPPCAEAAKVLNQIAAKPNVSLRFKHYPLSSICNPTVSALVHEDACRASLASECAHKQGQFWEMNRLIFDNQEDLSRENINGLAKRLGLDQNGFATCMEDPSTMNKIQSDITAGKQVNVKGTPTIFIGHEGSWYQWSGSIEDLSDIFMIITER